MTKTYPPWNVSFLDVGPVLGSDRYCRHLPLQSICISKES